MSLSDKINSVQGIALAALQATANLNTYISTIIAPDIGGIPVVHFNNTWSSLVNNTIPSLLPISRFNNTMNSYLSKTEASSTYVSNVYLTGLSIGYNNTINNILNNIITVNSDIGNIKSTLPNLLLINNFNNTISSYLQTNNFNNTINNYLLTNNFNNTINNYLQTNHFNNTINNYLLTNNFNNTISTYLQTNNFNNTINNYLQTNNFNNTISNYLLTNNFNNTINNYLQNNNFNNTIKNCLQTNNFNNTINNYLKTTDFNQTSLSLVNTTVAQTISGDKTFSNMVLVKNGRGSVKIYSQNGQVGPATYHTYRYSDQAMPSQGDHWEFGNDLVSGIPDYQFLERSFVFASGGAGTLVPRFYINSNGLVSVMDGGSFYSPAINTPLLQINGTNISLLYQSKADMTNYITSGTLTNYVNITGNQSIGGKKSFTGGLHTKSQTVSGTTDLNDDILFGVVKVAGSGNIRLPSPIGNAGGRISFYFEADCTLQTPSGVFTGTIATGGSALPITIASFGRHLECYSDGVNWIIMRSSGDVSSITPSSLGLGNVANTGPSDLPISDAVSSVMSFKANLTGANFFSGNITAPTIHATTSILVGGTNLSDIYLRTINFSGSINNYLLTNNFTNTINNHLQTNNFNNTINNYLLTNNFTNTINNYLQTNNFNNTINNYLLTNNFNNTINNFLQTNNFNNTINNYLLTNNFNNTINNFLQTNNFNNTINNYLLTNNFNNTINNFLQTSNFNNTINN